VAVMHFAALSLVGESMADPGRYWRVNIGSALNLIEVSLFLHDFTAWFSHDFRKVPPEVARVSALRFQFHYGLQ
jgi:dTDP-D-glucose 4,6-dehydratase